MTRGFQEVSMRCLLSLFAVLLGCSFAAAGDWPQWLGPHRDTSSAEKVAPWKEAPKVLWRVAVGEGHSSPVVAGGRVFLHARVKDKNEEEVLAFDAKTGKPLWNTGYTRADFKSFFGNGPRATPAVVDGRVYTFGITGVLSCFEADGGKQVWQVDTLKDFKAQNLFFGMSCSPLVEGKGVLVNVGAKGASVVAFDRAKGNMLWKSQDDKASYSSPIVFGEGKTRQAVFLTGANVLSLGPEDGSLLWKFPFTDALNESATTPVKVGDLLLASTITAGSVGLRLGSKDGKPAAEKVWKNEELNCYFSTPVAVGKEHVYLVTGTRPPAITVQADLHCIDVKTGKDLWEKPEKVGQYHASLLRTGDDKLLMLDDAGNLILLDPSPKGYRELARSKVCGSTWAHPALSDGRLYVRDNKELICLQLGE
jgi:outer membrane protein assembly factor BamB